MGADEEIARRVRKDVAKALKHDRDHHTQIRVCIPQKCLDWINDEKMQINTSGGWTVSVYFDGRGRITGSGGTPSQATAQLYYRVRRADERRRCEMAAGTGD